MALSEIRVNTTKTRTGVGTITYTETGPVITGIATASNFKTGSTNVHSTGVELANINTGGSTATFGGPISGTTASFSGNVSIGGTLTYEDVTNIDSVGILTARAGIKDSTLTSGRVTYAGSGGRLVDSANLTYDGANQLKMVGSGQQDFIIGSTNAGGSYLILDGDSNGDAVGADYAYIAHDTGGDVIIGGDNPSGDAAIIFKAGNNAEKVRIQSGGDVLIGTTTSAGKLTVDSGTSNTCATFQSSDAGAGINVKDNHARSSIEQNGTTLKISADTGGEYANSDIRLQVDGASKAMIDSVGRMLVGMTTPMTTGSNDGRDTIQAVHTAGAQLLLARNDTATITGNRLGEIAVLGNDSNGTYQVGASIRFEADSNHGDNDKPTRIVFKNCADGSATLTERLRINKDGVTLVNKTSTSDYGKFEVKGGTADDIETADITAKTIATFSGSTPGTTAAGKGAGIVIKPIADRGCNYFIGVANDSTNQEAHGRFIIRSGNLAGQTTERFRIASDGKVGINDSTPMEMLDVGGSVQASGGYKIAGHPVVTYASFTDISGGSYATRLGSTGTSTLRSTQIYGGGGHLATFDGVNNRLGISITNPDTSLHIKDGTLMIHTTTNFYTGSGENGENYPTIFFKGDHSSGNNPAHGKITVRHSNQNTYSGDILLMPQGYYSSYGYQEVLRVSAYKRVGINRGGDPGHTLDVYNEDGSDCLRLDTNASASGSSKQNAIRFSTSGTVRAHVGVAVDAGRLMSTSASNDFCVKTNTANSKILVGAEGNEIFRISKERVQTRTLSGDYYPVVSARDGSSSGRAATSAWEIKKTLGPAAKTGYYYLKNPHDSNVDQWWCDMKTDGGGWILVAHHSSGILGSDPGHWYNRDHRGGFRQDHTGTKKGGGYWQTWGDLLGEIMIEVRMHGYYSWNHGLHDDHAQYSPPCSKVGIHWGKGNNLPAPGTGNGTYSNFPSSRAFRDWCWEIENAPGYNPGNYSPGFQQTIVNGQNHFTEHFLFTWSMRGTGGSGDDGSNGPYWQIGSHHDGLHQHYEESASGDSYGDGRYQIHSGHDTSWQTDNHNIDGMSALGKGMASNGIINFWMR